MSRPFSAITGALLASILLSAPRARSDGGVFAGRGFSLINNQSKQERLSEELAKGKETKTEIFIPRYEAALGAQPTERERKLLRIRDLNRRLKDANLTPEVRTRLSREIQQGLDEIFGPNANFNAFLEDDYGRAAIKSSTTRAFAEKEPICTETAKSLVRVARDAIKAAAPW